MTKHKTAAHLRWAKQADQSLIYNSWLKNTWGSFFSYGIPKTLFFQIHAEIVKDLLNCSKTIVACDPNDHDQIFGFLTYESVYPKNKFIIHFVYVKSSYRMFGIASTMKDMMFDMEKNHIQSKKILIATHYTMDAREFLNKAWGLIYSPYLLWKEVYAARA